MMGYTLGTGADILNASTNPSVGNIIQVGLGFSAPKNLTDPIKKITDAASHT